jgi:hypothetical protein
MLKKSRSMKPIERYLYDVLDFRLACLELNKLGWDLEISEPDSAGRECIRCKRTGNRCALEPLKG